MKVKALSAGVSADSPGCDHSASPAQHSTVRQKKKSHLPHKLYAWVSLPQRREETSVCTDVRELLFSFLARCLLLSADSGSQSVQPGALSLRHTSGTHGNAVPVKLSAVGAQRVERSCASQRRGLLANNGALDYLTRARSKVCAYHTMNHMCICSHSSQCPRQPPTLSAQAVGTDCTAAQAGALTGARRFFCRGGEEGRYLVVVEREKEEKPRHCGNLPCLQGHTTKGSASSRPPRE